MGIQQSSMMCADEDKKCAVVPPMPYSIYNTYAKTIPISDPNRQKILDTYVCNNLPGKVSQCCDKNSATANVIAQNGALINPVLDAQGRITEYQICKCTSENCERENCVGFRKPTNYEFCKARATDQMNVISMNTYIDRILEPHMYRDCYNLC